MRTVSEEASNAIGLIEAADDHLAKINAIRAWPGLSGAQRAAALVILCLQHAEATSATDPADVAAFLSISQERAEKLFDGVEAPPFALFSVQGHRDGWQATDALEYGPR